MLIRIRTDFKQHFLGGRCDLAVGPFAV